MNDNKEDGNYRTDCGSALPSCVLAEIKFSLLQHCRWSMLYIERAIGVRRDKCNAPSTRDYNFSSVSTNVTNSFTYDVPNLFDNTHLLLQCYL